MSSSVHFRFKSAREFETLSFEGDFLKVADLKVAIVERKKLNFGEGFDLEISDASTGDVFNDEGALVQKNTSVIVRRIPGLKQGGILSHQEMAAKNERYAEKQAAKSQQRPGTATDQNPALPKAIEGSDEAERIASLVMQSNVQYDQFPPPVRGRYANRSTYRGRPGNFGTVRNAHGPLYTNSNVSNASYPDRAPRPSSNYVCHRCNRPGHWIDQCPTNGDPTYDRIKVRAPTGIPRSMLRQVDAPESGTGLQDSSGQFVTLQPNEEEFARQTVGLRLSQAAAAAVDKDFDTEDDLQSPDNLRKSKENGNAGFGPHETSQDAVINDAKSRPKTGPLEHGDSSPHGSEEQESATDGVCAQRDNQGRVPSSERGPEGRLEETNSVLKGENHLTNHTENSAVPKQLQRTEQPPRGVLPNLPVPGLPPGFPHLGVPPIGPGMPPIPPHILMAMTITNGQNVGPPRLPPGIVPTMPLPFPSAKALSYDIKKQGTGDEKRSVTPGEKSINNRTSPKEDRGKEEDNRSRPAMEASRQDWSTNVGDGREEEQLGQQDVDHPCTEKIETAFNSKADSHVPGALPVDRRNIRALRQPSLFENEDGLHSEYRSSREPTSVLSHQGRERPRQSHSPLSRRVSSSQNALRGSPKRRERRYKRDEAYTSNSPRPTVSDIAWEDRQPCKYRRERNTMKTRLSEYRNSPSPGHVIRDSRRSSTSRQQSASPPLRGRHGKDGTTSPSCLPGRSSSSERRDRYGSPRHRFRRESLRDRYQKENHGRSRREISIERRFRSRTPPRSIRYDSEIREDSYMRQHCVINSEAAPTAEKGLHTAFDRGSGESCPQHFEAGDHRASESLIDDRSLRKTSKNARRYPTEALTGPRNASDRSSQGSMDKSPARSFRGDVGRKREFDKRRGSERLEAKRPRREHVEQRKSVYRHEMRDRPSVHDRLGRPVEGRKKQVQRRSVHDRLG